MKRILVTGNAGAGKTTLAQKVAQMLDLPFHSLDIIVWQPGWKKTPAEEKEKKINALTAQEYWVIDGVSFSVQDRADTVVFLDVPRRLSFLRAASSAVALRAMAGQVEAALPWMQVDPGGAP